MTDAQVALVLSGIAALGGSLIAALKWAVARVTKSNDDGTAALVANTASNAVLIAKMDELVRSNTALAGKIDGIGDFVEEHTPIGPVPKPRTPPRGVYAIRPGTNHDKER